MFYVISLLLIIFFYMLNIQFMTAQVFMVTIWLAFSETAGVVVRELEVVGYPKEKYVKIGSWSKILRLNDNILIPATIKRLIIAMIAQLFLFSIVLGIVNILSKELIYIVIGCYSVIITITLLYCIFTAYRIAFYRKFKRINIYNWYYLLGYSRFKKEIHSTKVGKCTIIGEEVVRGKRYYVVEIKKSGRKYEKVMYCGGGIVCKNNIYVLYEIKKVYYIV